jgi:hypothetical protein
MTARSSLLMRERKIRMKMRREIRFLHHSSRKTRKIMAKKVDQRPLLQRWMPQGKERGSKWKHTKAKQKDQTGQWSDKNNQDKSSAPKRKGNNGALEKTTLFPLGTKPFKRGEKDSERNQLLALGHTIAEQDKSECGGEVSGSVDEHEALLDNFGEFLFTGRSPLPLASEGSDGSTLLDYSGDNDEVSTKTSDDNLGKENEEDTTVGGQSDKDEFLVEISARSRKPVLTQQVIMDLVENQTSSRTIFSNTGWDKKKEEFGEMLNGYESPTSRTVQVDVGLATLMIISAVAENTNRISIAAQQEQREIMMRVRVWVMVRVRVRVRVRDSDRDRDRVTVRVRFRVRVRKRKVRLIVITMQLF